MSADTELSILLLDGTPVASVAISSSAWPKGSIKKAWRLMKSTEIGHIIHCNALIVMYLLKLVFET